MKKIIVLALIFVLILSGCGTNTEAPQATVTEATPEVADVDALLVDDTTVEADSEDTDIVDDLLKYVDGPLQDIIDVYGEPVSSEYASSCLGDGDDGVLKFDGFTVYTYKEADQETVLDVR